MTEPPPYIDANGIRWTNIRPTQVPLVVKIDFRTPGPGPIREV